MGLNISRTRLRMCLLWEGQTGGVGLHERGLLISSDNFRICTVCVDRCLNMKLDLREVWIIRV